MVSELLMNRPRSDEFMLIACDGIWNVLTSHAAVSFVREQIAEYKASDKCSKTWLSDIAGQVTSLKVSGWSLKFSLKFSLMLSSFSSIVAIYRVG